MKTFRCFLIMSAVLIVIPLTSKAEQTEVLSNLVIEQEGGGENGIYFYNLGISIDCQKKDTANYLPQDINIDIIEKNNCEDVKISKGTFKLLTSELLSESNTSVNAPGGQNTEFTIRVILQDEGVRKNKKQSCFFQNKIQGRRYKRSIICCLWST